LRNTGGSKDETKSSGTPMVTRPVTSGRTIEAQASSLSDIMRRA